jgi:hypothetical protein
MRPQILQSVALTNDANGIFEDQTLAGSGALTLNGALVSGGIAYLYGPTSTTKYAQKVSIEGTGNNSGISATIVGTGAGGDALTEVLTLANNGTATTTGYFRTVSSVTVSGAVTGNIEGGFLSTNGAVSATMIHDRQQLPFNLSCTVALSSGASLTYTVQHSPDNPHDNYGTSNYSSSATWIAGAGLTSQTGTLDGNIAFPTYATRLLISAYTSGTAKYTAIQGNPY